MAASFQSKVLVALKLPPNDFWNLSEEPVNLPFDEYGFWSFRMRWKSEG
jgi:hypothetical protein